MRRPGEPPLHAVAEQIHAFSAGALGPGGIPVRADRRVDLSVHPPRVAGAAIGISSRYNPPAALSPQAEQLQGYCYCDCEVVFGRCYQVVMVRGSPGGL